ncbi:hypothetical protein L1987_20583 [Smallanthus sonchifolius]|uniref:Uncharacterized protein n=1 Tax=Smallanthus sonchifolius TaxID=185202 RepID=A0ACB9ISM3_9ASTR|nr:hypothetical protein L1987_20583 [Smallanthus sonchifolius]
MYGWSHKSVRESKPPKKTQNPSFSSSVLDEIYRSMDAGDEKQREEKVSRKQRESGGGGGSTVEDERIATLRRAFLVQKWMNMKVNAKNFTHRRRASLLPEYSHRKSVIDDDPFFFTSQKPSCFGPLRPKRIKTEPFPTKHHQPISPGGRLTTFLNSLLTNVHLKKPKDLKNVKIERTSKSAHGSTCSSASSFTRSCLSKNSPRSREKLNNGIRRTVRFYPVSVIIDEDCRPCGQKFIFGEQDFMKVHVTRMCEDKFDDDEEDDYVDDNDDDMTSDASSDLFELDHLSILKECDELPVYETTHFGTNRAIAKGLIC